MNYRVFWHPGAELLLDKLIEAAEEPGKIAVAAKEIDRQLVRDPFGFGESRDERVRIAFVSPLAVEFHVVRDVSTVIVFNVWRTGRRQH